MAWARFGVSLTERMPCSVQFSDKMNVGMKSSLLSLAVADGPARYTAALDLGRAQRSHHFGIVTSYSTLPGVWRALLADTKML
jgi:hypothetical protein